MGFDVFVFPFSGRSYFTEDVALGGYVEPLPLEPAGSAACSSNGGCAALGLTAGDCCSLATTSSMDHGFPWILTAGPAGSCNISIGCNTVREVGSMK